MQEAKTLHGGCFRIVMRLTYSGQRTPNPKRKGYNNRGSPDIHKLTNDAQKTGPTGCADWQILLD